MEFKLRSNAKYFTDEEIIEDIKHVANELNKDSLSRKEYNEYWKVHPETIRSKFKSWNNALKLAWLKNRLNYKISEEELFNNLEVIWRSIWQQPTINQMNNEPSKYSWITYQRKYGSWFDACKRFIEYKKWDINFIKVIKQNDWLRNRNIKEKDKLKILKRDNYKCAKCWKSPVTNINCFLHIDHIKPFSKWWSNDYENLQTLCNKCNLWKWNDESL